MLRRLVGPLLALLVSATMVAGAAPAAVGAQSEPVFTAEQLDNLMAPIALYPDPLIAQFLPASTFVDQIDAASRLVRGISDTTKIDKKVEKEDWDVSVKAVAHYPQVVNMMADDLDWTAAVGQAYVTQSTDVLASIQRLRKRAYDAGTLATTPQQEVVVEQQTIKVVPAQPQVIYVPQYNPQVVYVEHEDDDDAAEAAVVGAIAFGTGLAIGAWLNNDCDWYHGNVYYHGWSGAGWVGTSRAYVNVNNNVYVNRSYTNVNVNRTVVNRNVNYNNISNYNNVSRNVNYDNVNRARGTQTAAGTGAANRQVNNRVLDSNVRGSDPRVDAARGRTTQSAAGPSTQPATRPAAQPGMQQGRRPSAQPTQQPPSQRAGRQTTERPQQFQGPGAFGGAKNRSETQADSARGRASRSEAARQPATPERSRPSPAGGGRRGGGRRG